MNEEEHISEEENIEDNLFTEDTFDEEENDYDDNHKISEIEMKDLYLYIDEKSDKESVSYNPKHQIDGSTNCLYIKNKKYDKDINSLKNILREKSRLNEFMRGEKPLRRKFSINHDHIRYRVSCYQVLDGKIYCAMRRFPKQLPDINSLNLDRKKIDILRNVGKTRHKGGMIILGGRTGAGKTTTLIATIRMYLQEFGGFLYCIEDPIEYVLQGRFTENIDNANVIQREAETEEEWSEGIEDALRSAPQYIFVGEIRTPLAAAQAIRAASTGHLVITTTHGGSIVQTIANIMNIARIEMKDLAAPQLADCLRLVAHQEIFKGKPRLTTLSFDGEDGITIRNKVSDGINHLKQLETYIQQQDKKNGTIPSLGGSSSKPITNNQRPKKLSPLKTPPKKPEPPKKKGFFR